MEFMDLMEKLMRGAKKTGEVALQKSGDVVKLTKMKMAILSTENKIKDAYSAIGKIVYEAYCNDEGDSDAIEMYCQEIDVLVEELNAIKEAYADVRNVRRCGECGAENTPDAIYCSKCAAPLEALSQPADEEDDDEDEDLFFDLEMTDE